MPDTDEAQAMQDRHQAELQALNDQHQSELKNMHDRHEKDAKDVASRKNYVQRSSRNGGDLMPDSVVWSEAEDEVSGKTSNGNVNYDKSGKAYSGGADQRVIAEQARKGK